MYEENILLLITALAQDAAEEYREYRQILKNKTLSRKEREYYNMRAEETLKFFDSKLFTAIRLLLTPQYFAISTML